MTGRDAPRDDPHWSDDGDCDDGERRRSGPDADATPGTPAATDTLYLHAGTERPDLSAVSTYASCRADLAGATVRFDVIGASHHVHAPAWGVHETASCRPLGPGAEAVALEPGVALDRAVETPAVAWRLRVETRPLALPDREFDLHHAFDPGAVTAVAVGADRFETYHTYPEHDLTLYTETTVERR